jgi:hypothetical protein
MELYLNSPICFHDVVLIGQEEVYLNFIILVHGFISVASKEVGPEVNSEKNKVYVHVLSPDYRTKSLYKGS